MHVKHLLLAGLFVASAAAGADADSRWGLGVGAEVQLNPGAPDNGSSTFAAGASVQVYRAVDANTSVGARFDALALYPLAETHEESPLQHDLVLTLRRGLVRPDRPTAGFDVGIGVSRYTAGVDLPDEPGCVGCGRYGGVTYRPTVHAGLDVNVPVSGGWAIIPRVRAVVIPVRAEALDRYNFLPGTFGMRFDLVVVAPL